MNVSQNDGRCGRSIKQKAIEEVDTAQRIVKMIISWTREKQEKKKLFDFFIATKNWKKIFVCDYDANISIGREKEEKKNTHK